MRFLQYLPGLAEAGIHCRVSALFKDDALLQKYRSGRYAIRSVIAAYIRRCMTMANASAFDLVWIEKEALPWFPSWVEQLVLYGKRYVVDFDDAIFHNYDLHRLRWVRVVYGRRVDGLMAKARLVIAGNRYLAQRAEVAG